MDVPVTNMLTAAEEALNQTFLSDGYLVVPVENQAGLDRIRDCVAELAASHLKIDLPNDRQAFLDGLHQHVDVPGLNDMRLAVINGMNQQPWLRATYFSLVRSVLDQVVGNELVMQRRINLSIQLPEDDSSLLPVHADVWDGDSAYEVVVWVPLVDCFKTKGMYILPPTPNDKHAATLSQYADGTTEDIYHAIEPDLQWPDLPYGKAMVFSQTLMHGNRINEEPETRWSMNCRFKSMFSPYADKLPGEFFEPVTLRAASRFGLDYKLPSGFEE
jgi:sporadic carbohydrate cluster 2OG-Fe(II) oxygenase